MVVNNAPRVLLEMARALESGKTSISIRKSFLLKHASAADAEILRERERWFGLLGRWLIAPAV
jgi:hypothetical protein